LDALNIAPLKWRNSVRYSQWERKIMTRNKKLVSLALAVLMLAGGTAFAQGFPNKTVRLISGVTPGSASDTMARIVAEKLQASLGQPVIVENRLGAGGLVGATSVAKGEADGHTIMVWASAYTVAPLLTPGQLDPRDLTPVATMATIPTVLILSTAKGHKTLAGLVAAAKARPGDIVGTTAGIGSATHMNLERFRISAGIEVLRLHMKGAPEALTEVLTGRSDFYFAQPFQVASNLKEGKIVAVAVGSPKRSALFPDLPTTVEAGFPNSDYNFWVGALMATRTPRDIVLRLNREINAAMAASDVRERTLKLGADPLSMSLPDFEAMIREEFESNARLIKAADIKAN
jgi:tripartite-type tricarboxylate transporter receptor subunit TctC